jgi:N-acetylmuramic acid 6-phosphate etherase
MPDLASLTTYEMVEAICRQNDLVSPAVGDEATSIANAIDLAAPRLNDRGRLVLVGAGTSGRLALMQAAEMGPTFGVDTQTIRACTPSTDPDAGVSEDDVELGPRQLLSLGLNQRDVIVGISASGHTPYVLSSVGFAESVGAARIAITCNDPTPLGDACDVVIHPVVGPEVLTGSSRLKAGTAQKLVLDMLTTGTMVRLGYVYANRMIALRPTNSKLRDRALRIVADITGASADRVETALMRADWSVPTAIVMLEADLSPAEARSNIDSVGSYAEAIRRLRSGKSSG